MATDTYTNKLLIATVGLPRCGKSSWARSLNQPIVNPDAIRMALHGNEFIGDAEDFVWAIARTMTKSLFLAGHDIVVLDATNTTIERRRTWISKRWTTKWKVFSPFKPQHSLEICLQRAGTNMGLQNAIRTMFNNYQHLTENELEYQE